MLIHSWLAYWIDSHCRLFKAAQVVRWEENLLAVALEKEQWSPYCRLSASGCRPPHLAQGLSGR